MEQEEISDIFIKNFQFYYQKLVSGETGFIGESAISPVESLPDSEKLSEENRKIGKDNLSRTIFLKLNGGLGTSMGLERAKSLLKVKKDYTFLDIIAQQSIIGGYQLLLMNSYSTHKDSLHYLKKYPALWRKIPLDFIQHKEPKVDKEDLRPVVWPKDPQLEWCPPGHGDLYISISTSGVLDQLLENDFEYAFVSNADNLGAVLDPGILGYFIGQQLPFMMEVADRTEADKKGGHLAQLKNGQFILREIAQCPPDEVDAFQDVSRYRYFNTNNLWIHLPSLAKMLKKKKYIMELPMILNEKTVDPRDPDSTPVYQIETAVGSAISVFKGSSAIRVPRTRFAPVKNTNDLLAVRSDMYQLTPDFKIIPIEEREAGSLEIDLDKKYYKLIDEFEARFPSDVPSLKNCFLLKIDGDVKFGKNIILKDRVHLINQGEQQITLENGSVISGELELRRD
ncbi:MAG: UTP--glucose-1-phosphate uridylyltransferase [Calditrichaeota bacterium]|nr:UTP--glucose-1-phosphate uridylyltransferase [Calditrichota bacterium]RQW04883.1 MAG: UTP--glucose-1-phosphate uridylyltransferase [Calditrichota bacterium]